MANPWSPVHWSPENGVHSDRFTEDGKFHQPFSGQTTIDTFTNPSYRNDRDLRDLGGNPPSIDHGNFGTMFGK